jgi:hypothetical protein
MRRAGRRAAVAVTLALVAVVPAARATAPSDAPSGAFDWYSPPHADVDAAAPTRVLTMVPVEGPIRDLDLGVSLQGGYTDQLRLTLVHRGVSAVIYEGGGSSPTAFVDALFDDEAASDYAPTGQLEGSFRPGPDALSAFDGVELSGLWELRIEDPSGTPGDGSDLVLFRLAGTVGLAGPPLVVALYDDPSFVDSVDQSGDSEAENLYAALVAFGHDVRRFTGTGSAAFSAALAGADVLVFPELEEDDLAPQLAAGARQTIAGWVEDGGRLVACHGTARTTDLVNAILGTSFTAGGIVPGPLGITTEARVTPFQGGPNSLPELDASDGFAWLPPAAWSAYANGNLPGVVTFSRGFGDVTLLAWDFFDALPLGAEDGGWLETLHRAVLGLRAVPSRAVAFFADGDFVDDAPGEEMETLQSSLLSVGHEVLPFAGTSEMRLREALAGVSALVVPELENGSPIGVMTPGARQVLADFVAGGGVLIKAGGNDAADLEFLNALFGFTLALGTSYNGTEGASAILQSTAKGTTFANGPVPFLTYSRTTALADLPPGARSLYRASDGMGENLVAELPFGAGKVIWLGWDWNGAAPRGGIDSLWSEVLHRAVLAAPEPGATPLGAAALAALTWLGRRRRRRAVASLGVA